MKIFILYETYNIEFFGKYILGKYLVSKFDKNVEVQVGFYRDLMLQIYKCKPNEKVIIIGNQIYKNNQVLIDYFNFKNFVFFGQHEEEHSLFSVNIENYFKLLISRHYFNKFQKYLCFNNKTKKVLKNILKIENNMLYPVGNAKYDFLSILKNHADFSKKLVKQEKFILITLPDSFFKTVSIYREYLKNNKKISITHSNDQIIGNRSLSEAISTYFYMKQFLKSVMILSKINKKDKIIIKPHPSDYEFLSKLKSAFKNFQNVKIETKHEIYHLIMNSKFVISSPSSPIIDSALMGKKVICFYNKKNRFHRFVFSKHPSIKFKNVKFVSHLNFKSLENIILNCKVPKILPSMLPPKKFHYENIYNQVKKVKFGKIKKNIFLDKLIFKKVIKKIEEQKKKREYGLGGAKKFNSKFKISFERALAVLYFWDNPFRLDFLNILRKFVLGRSFTNVDLKDWHGGYNQKINIKTLILFEKYFKKELDFFNKSNFKVKNKKVIILKKN